MWGAILSGLAKFGSTLGSKFFPGGASSATAPVMTGSSLGAGGSLSNMTPAMSNLGANLPSSPPAQGIFSRLGDYIKTDKGRSEIAASVAASGKEAQGRAAGMNAQAPQLPQSIQVPNTAPIGMQSAPYNPGMIPAPGGNMLDRLRMFQGR